MAENVSAVKDEDEFSEENTFEVCSEFKHADTEVNEENSTCARRRLFSSISEAVRCAKNGTCITIRPGSYTETSCLVLDKDHVKLVASEIPKDGQVVKISFGSQARASIVCRGSGILLQGLEIVQLKEDSQQSSMSKRLDESSCVRVEFGSTEIKDCSCTSELGYALIVLNDAKLSARTCTLRLSFHGALICGGSSHVEFSKNVVSQNTGFGIVTLDDAAGTFSENSIHENGKCGVVCSGQSSAVFESNTVADGAQGGFWSQDRSTCTIRRNRVYNNLKTALQVSNMSEPDVSDNKIFDGRGGGIIVHDSAKGTYRRNLLSNNFQAGLGVMDNACPLLVDNTVLSNKSGGVVMAGSARAVFVGNTISGNSFAGVGLKESAQPLFDGTIIRDNHGYGVLMQGSCLATLQNCVIEGNKKSGVCGTGTTSVTVDSCTIGCGNEQRTGFLLHDSASMQLFNSHLFGHHGGNVVMRDKTRGTLERNTIAESEGAGLVLQGNSDVKLFGNVIRDGKVSNVVALDGARVLAVRNSLMDSHGVGMLAMDSCSVKLAYNLVIGNGGTGIHCTGNSSANLCANRISQNESGGVMLEQSQGPVLCWNVIYDNGGPAIQLQEVNRGSLVGNIVLGGSRESAVPVMMDNQSSGRCEHNYVQANKEMEEVARGSSVDLSSNHLLAEEHWEEVVHWGLDEILKNSGISGECVVIEMPGESEEEEAGGMLCVGLPSDRMCKSGLEAVFENLSLGSRGAEDEVGREEGNGSSGEAT
ncbi:hypothetical protein GUITHDRAFT_104449 [Guillardia theta CCMP2712]|uniref:Right handed beta helix domain-containing protein n=1 Tax=Guillardia theta (strain CCMP2712) TaxID=905079 RepID=L1JNL5_GUITC|nr:hypothetical protein GUITHDRAFT_104449 [Guillardia theta CCMP2712]EKX50052.1 hypothetical protein GUITHDRAFT_104449 [Guillardia theta CCMP2712]|eukprot:XP_005837032.1 hypothetical protein GUITHDRAFT_104449 [Guillardia theta CCMP2712]